MRSDLDSQIIKTPVKKEERRQFATQRYRQETYLLAETAGMNTKNLE